MAQLTNITAGPKGIHTKDGALVMIAPGASEDVDVEAKDVNKEWFTTGGKSVEKAGGSEDKAEG